MLDHNGRLAINVPILKLRSLELWGALHSGLERARPLSDAMRRLAANVPPNPHCRPLRQRRAERAASLEEDGTTPGGPALRFYSSTRLAMERHEVVQDAVGAAGSTVKLTRVKNKLAPPLRSCDIRLLYGHGFASGP